MYFDNYIFLIPKTDISFFESGLTLKILILFV